MVETEQLLALANSDPKRGLDEATAVIEASPAPSDRSIAHRAAGVAHRNLGDLKAARAALAASMAAATEIGDERLRALASMSDALILSKSGQSERALQQLDEAERGLVALEKAELRFQRALVLTDVAEFPRARADFTAALRVFRRNGQAVWEGDALLGRAVAAGSMGDLRSARRDLRTAVDLFEREGDRVGVGMAMHNTAWVSWLGGGAVRAVVEHDEATQVLDEAGFPTELIHADRCEALASVGLYREAIDLAAIGAAAQERAGNALEAADQRMALARALMMSGRADDGRHQAEMAAEAFRRNGQRLHVLRAETLIARLDLDSGQDPAVIAELATSIAQQCLDAGNTEYEGGARLLAARAALASGQLDLVRAALRDHARRHRPFSQEVERISLRALLHQSEGATANTLRAVRRGLRLVRSFQETVDSVEIRATLSQHVTILRDLGVAALIGRGQLRKAVEMLEEATLSVHLGGRHSVTPPAELVEHRALGKSIAEADLERRDIAPLRRRQAQLERVIRRQRIASIRRVTQPSMGIENRALVRRYAAVDRRLWALDLISGRVTGHAVADLDEVEALTGELLFLLRQSFASPGAGLSGIEHLAALLDDQLGLPGTVGPAHEPLSVVAGDALRTLPFGLLPSMSGRTWAMSPRASGSPSRPGGSSPDRILAIAGPRLIHGPAELAAIERTNADVETMSADLADSHTVLDALSGATLAHIVAHSVVSDENPMFSSIELSDGPLYLHELESIRNPPRVLVLASCSSARSTTVGTASLGFVESLLEAGIEAVVGTAVDIPDDENTVEVMRRLHSAPLATDVALAVRAVAGDDSLDPSQRLIARCLVPTVAYPIMITSG